MADHEFDVFTALHDDMKGGGKYTKVRSRVVISAQEFPSTAKAADVACALAVALHGGMATDCLLRI